VDQLNKWFQSVADSPAGSIILFVCVFLTRVVLDRIDRKRESKRKKKKKVVPHG